MEVGVLSSDSTCCASAPSAVTAVVDKPVSKALVAALPALATCVLARFILFRSLLSKSDSIKSDGGGKAGCLGVNALGGVVGHRAIGIGFTGGGIVPR